MIDGTIKPVKKPDLDNIAKICLDALNKLAFDDDSQIVALRVEKHYSEEPRVEIEITEREV
jgi:Holliday junction resolvase RusA-like endonuclease